MVEEARLESVYTSKAYHGFESRPFRFHKTPQILTHAIQTQYSLNSMGEYLFFVCLQLMSPRITSITRILENDVHGIKKYA